MKMNEEKSEIQSVESFLEEELRFVDVGGTLVPVKDMIDKVLEHDKGKRHYTTG